MFYARHVLMGPDGPDVRLLVSRRADDGWLDLRSSAGRLLLKRGATHAGAWRVASALAPGSLTAALESGSAFLDLAQEVCADTSGDLAIVDEPRLVCPVDPPMYRDFMAFEEHFRFGYEWRGLEVPEVMYELPVAYLGNPQSFVGPDDEVAWPGYTDELDYELEIGIVLSSPVSDADPSTALDHVLGVTFVNDFSARDIQRREMTAGLGPNKGKNFGTAVGPWIATLDELELPELRLSVEVNGELRGQSWAGEMIWSVAELVSWASTCEKLAQGSLLASGTANGCSGVEIGKLLQPGDRVTLRADVLGELTTTVGARTAAWAPQPRRRD